jgi:hypothetical protein
MGLTQALPSFSISPYLAERAGDFVESTEMRMVEFVCVIPEGILQLQPLPHNFLPYPTSFNVQHRGQI